MKRIPRALLILSFLLLPYRASPAAEPLSDFTLPLPDRFIELTREVCQIRGWDVTEFFSRHDVPTPPEGWIRLDDKNNVLSLRLPRARALKVVSLLDQCIRETPVHFFRGSPGGPPTAEDLARHTAFTFPIPADCQGKQGAFIRLEKGSRGADGSPGFSCFVVNNSGHPIRFTGGGPSNPILRHQILEDGKWVERNHFPACGLGITGVWLPSGRACRFQYDTLSTTSPFRVGLFLLDDISIQLPDNTIWSDPINPAALAKQIAGDDGEARR